MEDWWQEQIQNLNKKVEIFEKKEDKKRFEKRNNIVIIGLSLEEKKRGGNSRRLDKGKTRNKHDTQAVQVFRKERNVIVITMESWQNKKNIIMKKNILSTRRETERIFLNNDLT